MIKSGLRIFFLFLLLGPWPIAFAQFRVDVSGIGLNQLPIAVSIFRGEDESLQKISSIVLADLERSGQFRNVDASGAVLDETTRPDVGAWR